MSEEEKECPKCGKENKAYKSKLLDDAVLHYFRCDCDHPYVTVQLVREEPEDDDWSDIP